MKDKKEEILKEFDERFEVSFGLLVESGNKTRKLVTADYNEMRGFISQAIDKARQEAVSEYNNYLLQRFNDYEVPINMKPEDVRGYLRGFEKQFKN